MAAPLLPLSVNRDEGSGFTVKVDGKPFASYVVGEANKPYFWPVYGPTGKEMTRAFPMKEVPGEQRDHVHHRGITFGHENGGLLDRTAAKLDDPDGEAVKASGGGDSWSELQSYESSLKSGKKSAVAKTRVAGLARVVHKEYSLWKEGADGVEVGEICEHVDANGKRFMTEYRHFRFAATAAVRTIDFDQDLMATDGAVQFEDRKDAGLSIRVPSEMAVDSKKGGKILNSEGLTDAEAWGRPAKWCDYSGPVDGETLGVAILSHPSTYRFPDRWHVRTYGLFAVNPFGALSLDKTVREEAPSLIAAGGKMTLRHRFVFHKGDGGAVGVDALFAAYEKERR